MVHSHCPGTEAGTVGSIFIRNYIHYTISGNGTGKRTDSSFTLHGSGLGQEPGNDGFLYYTMHCTHYTGTGNNCFLLYLSRSLSLSRSQFHAVCISYEDHHLWYQNAYIYVSLRLSMQNRRKKWNFPLNFCTMRKLSDLYSGIFQTQSSGCASGVNYFRNFTKLKNLNI